MSILYRNLGGSKRLQEIVFAGSHDASITSGSSYAQTQDLDIAGQAEAGVRLFDLRILARKFKDGGASLVGYHGSGGGKSTSQLASTHTGKTHDVKTNSRITGEFGEKLSKMLKQAKDFVERTDEFLIFKFDKCTNYDLVAEYCVKLLGTAIYKPAGKEFSKLSLDDLKKKVVCVFNNSALSEIKNFDSKDGILGFKSLRGEKNSVGTYDPGYPGLQYYGKGGTKVSKIFSSNTDKMKENESTQKKMLLAMARQQDDLAANVLGMMYWTSTGVITSIRTRNDVMWNGTGVDRMAELWNQGLESSISTQLQRDKIKVLEYGGVRRVKAYFPNIVMIDFADPGKCQSIYALNTTVDRKLAEAYDKYTKAKG
jgi:hypothetical protein